MKKLLLTLILSAIILPAMADTSKYLEEILANKNLAVEIFAVLQELKEQQNKQEQKPDLSYFEKADYALNILIKENEQLKPLLEQVKASRKNLIIFLSLKEYISEDEFKQTCKELFYHLDALALDILEISKIDKNLAHTTSKIIDHQYFFNALALEVNISAMTALALKYYKPDFYENMALADFDLTKSTNKIGYNKEWEDFIDNWIKKHSK